MDVLIFIPLTSSLALGFRLSHLHYYLGDRITGNDQEKDAEWKLAPSLVRLKKKFPRG
jgi:hypothetical protein